MYDALECGADWWGGGQLFYARNAHPLASICLSHKAHPYSKCERVVVEALLLVLAWGNACLINVAAWSGCVCPDDPLYDTPEQIECRDGTATLVLSVLNAFSLVLLGTLLKACATCGCVQSHHESDKELAQRGAHIAEGVSAVWARDAQRSAQSEANTFRLHCRLGHV